jgi:hypothetical protein
MDKQIYPYILLIPFIGVFFLIYYLIDHHLEENGKKIKYITFTLMIIFCSIYFILANIMMFNPNADLGILYELIMRYAKTGDFINVYKAHAASDYLAIYPNNHMVFFLLAIFNRALYYLHLLKYSLYACANLSALCVSFSLINTWLISKQIFDNKKSLFIVLLVGSFVPLSLYSCYFYTDTLALPFFTGALCLYVKAIRLKDMKKSMIFMILSAIVFALGYKMKGSLAVPFLTGIIYNFIKFHWKKSLALSLCFILVFTCSLKMINMSFEYLGIYNETRAKLHEFPFEHWVNMGLRDPGGFSKEQYRFTFRLKDAKTKKIENRKLLKSTLNKKINDGSLITHLNIKTIYIWSEADYHVKKQVWVTPLNPHTFGFESYIRLSHPDARVYNLFKSGKFERKLFDIYTRCFQLMLLIMFIIGTFKTLIKPNKDERLIFQGITIGIAIFLLIWEARSRYLLSLTPAMLLLMVYSFEDLLQLIRRGHE